MTSAIRWPLILLLAGSITATPARSIAQSAADSTASPAATDSPAAGKDAGREAKKAAKAAAKAQADSVKAAERAAKKAAKAAADSVKAAERAQQKAARGASTSMSAADLTAAPMSPDSAAAKKAAERAAKNAAKLAAKAEKDSLAAKKAAEREAKKAATRAGKTAGTGAAMGFGATPAPADPGAAMASGSSAAPPADSAAAKKAAQRAAKDAARAEKKAAKLAAKAVRSAGKSGSDAGKAAVSAAPAAPAATIGRVLTPLGKRTSDEVIARDLAWIEELRAKLDGMPATADPWRVAGARLWLDAAREEYLDNDETRWEQAAFAAASALVAALESGAAPVTKETVPAAQLLNASTRLRGDLWDKLETLKRDEGFPCAAAELAMLEVELQWAGHEHVDRGECASEPHLSLANQHALAAEALASGCRKPPVAPIVETPPAPKVEPVPAPPLQMPTAEELRIPKDVHFALDKHYIGPKTRLVIVGVANVLLKYPSVYVHLTGHTDSRGSYEYNLALSQRRVHAVFQVLRELGIDSTRITIEFVGKSKLYAAETSTKGYALNRRVEMEFQDVEGREIKAERTEADLQIEADRPPPPPPAPARPKTRLRTTVRPKAAQPGVADSVPRLPRKPRVSPQGTVRAPKPAAPDRAVEPPMIERKPPAADTGRGGP